MRICGIVLLWGGCLIKQDLGYERDQVGGVQNSEGGKRIHRSLSVLGMESDILNFSLFPIYSIHIF